MKKARIEKSLLAVVQWLPVLLVLAPGGAVGVARASEARPFTGNESGFVTVHADMNLGFVFVTEALLFDEVEGAAVRPNVTPKGWSGPLCAQPAKYCVFDNAATAETIYEVASWRESLAGSSTWHRLPGKLALLLMVKAHMGSPVSSGSPRSGEFDAPPGSHQYFRIEWEKTTNGSTRIAITRWRVREGVNSRKAKDSDSLVRVAELGDASALRDRLLKRVNPDTPDPDAYPGISGWTPLMAAVESGQTEIAKVLLEAGASVNQRVKGANIDVPLAEAASEGQADVVRLLLDTKADVNARGAYGATALFFASQNGHADAVKLLLEARADVNAGLKNGATPLFTASQYGYADVVKLLLEAKADVSIRKEDGHTALSVARANRHAEIVQLLRDAGARK
jgi:ankyrin repeat protein